MTNDPTPPATPSGLPVDEPTAPGPSLPVAPRSPDRLPRQGLFHKRDDAIGQAPVFFSVALGIAFGSSVGLLVGQPIIGIIFGGLLGALYAMVRRANQRS